MLRGMGRSEARVRSVTARAIALIVVSHAGCSFDSGPLAGGPGLEPPGDPGKGNSGAGTDTLSGAGGAGGAGIGGASASPPGTGPGPMAGSMDAGDAGPLERPDAALDAATFDAGPPDAAISHDAAVSDAGGVGTCLGWTKPTGKCPKECQYCDSGRGICTIGCGGIGDGSCNDKTVMCPPGWACVVECNGFNTCTRGAVQCADGPCRVNCTGINSCDDWTLRCGADACSATCSSFGIMDRNFSIDPGKSCNVDGC